MVRHSVVSCCAILFLAIAFLDGASNSANTAGGETPSVTQSSVTDALSNQAKSKLITQLRKDFPKRLGIRMNSLGGDPKSQSETQIEVTASGERWRVTYGQRLAMGKYNYVVFESLLSKNEAIQVSNYGTSNSGLSQFKPDKTIKKIPVRFKSGFEAAGGGRLMRHDLLFGYAPNHKGLVDLHSDSFSNNSSLVENEDGSFDLVYRPSGVRFRYSAEIKCESVTIPDYLADEQGNLSVRFYWNLKPDYEKRLDDGGFLVFTAKKSTEESSETWFDKVKIMKLDGSETLRDFKINTIPKGTRVIPVGQDSPDKEKVMTYSKGEVRLTVDVDAEREIDAVLESSGHTTTEDEPVTLSRFPYLRRTTSTHCGLYSFAIAAAQLGKQVNLETIVSENYTSGSKGSTIDDLTRAAADFGLHGTPIRAASLDMLNDLNKPAIIHSGNSFQIEGVSHWMAILKTDQANQRVLVADLPRPPKWLSEAELLAWWDGTAIVLSESPIPASTLLYARLKSLIPVVVIGMTLMTLWFLVRRYGQAKQEKLSLGFACLIAPAVVIGLCWNLFSPTSFNQNQDAVAMVRGKAVQDSKTYIKEHWSWNSDWQSDEKTLLVDARMPSDYSVARAKKAVNLAPDCSVLELRDAWSRAKKAELVVVYCQSEGCTFSHTVARKLILMGHSNVVIYRPGLAELPADLIEAQAASMIESTSGVPLKAQIEQGAKKS